MKEQNLIQPTASVKQNLSTLTPQQSAKLLFASKALHSEIKLDKLSQYLISYAWKCAEDGEVPDEMLFILHALLRDFDNDMKGILELH